MGNPCDFEKFVEGLKWELLVDSGRNILAVGLKEVERKRELSLVLG
jgi:hypothetical protein